MIRTPEQHELTLKEIEHARRALDATHRDIARLESRAIQLTRQINALKRELYRDGWTE